MRLGGQDDAPAPVAAPVLRDHAWAVDFDTPLPPSGLIAQVVLANVRLDNAASLARSLDLPAHTTTEALLLAAYLKWGESCPDRLIGDFAFAVWDPARREIFAARDPFGVEPLFFWATADRAVVALRLASLFRVAGVSRSLHHAHIHRLVAGDLESVPEATAFDRIQRVLQGHFARIAPRRVQQERYWKPENAAEVRLKDDGEYARRLQALLAEAVRCRMPVASPVGAFLSGGLDSSFVAVLARDELQRRGAGPLRTFTLVFDTLPAVDERKFAAVVLASGGFDPEFIRGDLADPFTELRRLQSAQHDLLCLPNLHLHDAVYAAAAVRGVHVLLDGFDGDSAISHGLSWLSELAGGGRWARAVGESLALAWRSRAPVHRLFQRYVVPAAMPGTRRWLRRLRAGTGHPAAPLTERSAHEGRLCRPIIGLALEGARLAAESHGLEPRYPFFDRRLVEFCLGLPPEQKLARGWTRLVLRRAAEGMLPQPVQWRRDKSDLTPALLARLRANEVWLRIALADAEYDLAFTQSARWRHTFSSALRDASGTKAVSLWRILAAAEWVRLHGSLPPKETPP